MNALKTVLMIVLGLIAILLIAAAVVDGDYSTEREVIINKPKAEVFEYIKMLKNQENYSKWQTMDPNMIKSYKGTDGQVGFISAWDSEVEGVGTGEQEIVKIVDGERIDYELRFLKPMEDTHPAYMITEAMGESQTKVKWGFVGEMPYPMSLVLLFQDIEEMVGNDFQIGLDRLKVLLEK